MSDLNWEKVETILDRALELPEEHRSDFIEQECGDDKQLKGEVTQLLESIFDSKGWLEEPGQYRRELFNELSEDIEAISTDRSLEETDVGSYTIRKKIGEGGMGSVYLAQRTDELFDHRVAIKIIRHGKATEENIRRFQREQRILAGLEHPGIARLLDGGVTGDGDPYIIMEYVDGIPLDTYCQKRNCSIQEKISLFRKVLEAVRHAHENLVIHRDLKPGNILVNESGNIKILDFGISKLLEEGPREKTLTQHGARLLTPRYAAPEQIRQQAVTTATDMYALGIIFYQLLANAHPFELDGLTRYEMEQTILEKNPPKLSELTSGDDIRKLLRGDLDAIALKAIRKEPGERYRGANEFLDDLNNCQKGIPVTAREDSLRYRIKKFFARHSRGASAAAVVLLLIIGLTGFYTWSITHERNQAQLEAEKAEQVTQFLVDLFSQSNPYFEKAQGGLDVKIGAALNYGAEIINEELAGQPEVQAELKSVIGEVYYQLGEFSRAETLLIEALNTRMEIYGEPRAETAETMRTLGFLYQEQGDFNRAESLLTKSIPIFENSRYGLNDQDAISAINKLGNLLWFNKGDFQRADSVLHRALELKQKYFGEDSLNIAKVLNDLAAFYHSQGQYDAAEPYYRRSINIYERLYDDHSNLAIIMSNFSALLRERGSYDEAEKYQETALNMHRKLTGKNSIDVALGLGNLGHISLEKNRLQTADSLIDMALRKLKAIYGEQHAYVARTKLNRGRLYLKLDSLQKAEQQLQEVHREYQQIYPPQHPRQSDPLLELGLLSLEMENPEQAKTYLEKAHQIRVKGYPEESWRVAQTMSAYGSCLSRLGDFEKADSLLVRSFNRLKELRGTDDKYTRVTRSRLITHYQLWDKPSLAKDYRL